MFSVQLGTLCFLFSLELGVLSSVGNFVLSVQLGTECSQFRYLDVFIIIIIIIIKGGWQFKAGSA